MRVGHYSRVTLHDIFEPKGWGGCISRSSLCTILRTVGCDIPTNQPKRLSTSLVRLYTNKTPLLPDGIYLDHIHKKWEGHYNLLEKHHCFIQWLFRTQKLTFHNPKAPYLTPNVARAKAAILIVREDFLKSYHIMLDFYGMRLIDKARGIIIRNPRNRKEQYHNVLHNFRDELRITRILTSLGEVMGWEHKFQLKPFRRMGH